MHCPDLPLPVGHCPEINGLKEVKVLFRLSPLTCPLTPKRVRITKGEVDKYGATPGCPRCADLDFGNQRTKKTHNEACRKIFHDLFKTDSNAKWAQAAHEYQRSMSRGGDLYRPSGANSASPASPVDLD